MVLKQSSLIIVLPVKFHVNSKLSFNYSNNSKSLFKFYVQYSTKRNPRSPWEYDGKPFDENIGATLTAPGHE